ncbi:MAG: FAD assembly factor SdhE [Acidiferrobacter sp.]
MIAHDRIRWRCRRGLLELDLMLGRFVDAAYGRLTSAERRIFDAFLTEADSDLWSWIQGADAPLVYQPVLRHLRMDAPLTSTPIDTRTDD